MKTSMRTLAVGAIVLSTFCLGYTDAEVSRVMSYGDRSNNEVARSNGALDRSNSETVCSDAADDTLTAKNAWANRAGARQLPFW